MTSPEQPVLSCTLIGIIRSYVLATRPWSFLLTLNSICLGSCLAYKTLGTFNVWIFILSLTSAVAVHCAANLVNTYYDYINGVDKDQSTDKTLVVGILSPSTLLKLVYASYLASAVVFALLIYISPGSRMTLGTIYISGTCVSFAYTGGIGLKYIALGDVTIAVTFGPMVFVFAYVSQTGLLVIAPIIYSLPLALLTEGCLHTNNVRDMKNDKEAGITTVALLLGETGSYIMFLILLFAPYAAFVLMLICSSLSFCLPLITFPAAFQIERLYRDKHYNEAIINVAHLNTKVTLFYICAVLLG